MRAMVKQWMLVAACAAGAVWAQASASVDCRVEMDNPVVLAGGRQKAVVKVTLDAPKAPRVDKRPPVNLTIVMDRSGSMSGQKIEKAREAAITALRRLGPEDLFSLVTYDDYVNTVIPAQSAANTEWIEARIRAIGPGGSTALFAGVSQGASEVRKNLNGRYVNRVLLLSDGLANVGPSSPEELGRLGTAFRKEGISVTTIGVGTDYNEDLMALMAQASDGNTYFVESSVDLPRIFGAELGDVLSVVASKVTIEVEFPDGIRPVRIIGRDGRLGANHVELSLNQLYGGQEKYALIEVELPEGTEGEVRKVADAHCSYQDMIANQPAASSGQAMVRFSRSRNEVDRNINVDVGTVIILNEYADAQAQAIEYADSRDYDKAADVLRKNSVLMKDYAAANALPELEQQADDTLKKAEEIEGKQGMDARQRKEMRTDNFMIYNQQETE